MVEWFWFWYELAGPFGREVGNASLDEIARNLGSAPSGTTLRIGEPLPMCNFGFRSGEPRSVVWLDVGAGECKVG